MTWVSDLCGCMGAWGTDRIYYIQGSDPGRLAVTGYRPNMFYSEYYSVAIAATGYRPNMFYSEYYKLNLLNFTGNN